MMRPYGKKTHATLLFMIAGNYLVTLITYNFPLWDLSSELGGHLINDTYLNVVVYPPTVFLLMRFYPNAKKVIYRILYISFCASVFTLVELIEYYCGNIHYYNNWNIWKSLFVNLGMFSVLRIHYSKPLLAYILFMIEVAALIIICKIPLSGIK
ncbi:CBO0543 family protein [Paenibacillus hamazuiensis]|uniref:CBO0543 family protein n=1 Tax=Paenibacillus hamazuiensis TaxID=2936508 RepID=UPI003B845F30